MLRYVVEEVDRVKGLFEDKEARLAAERDAAQRAEREAHAAAGQAERRAEAVAGEAASMAAKAADAEARLGQLPQQLQARALYPSRNPCPHKLVALCHLEVFQAGSNL